MSEIEDIRMQVMWNRLISVVEEQAMTLLRTAFSTSVREAGDLSAGVFDPQGRMLAQAVTGTPGHVNTMAEAVGHFIAEIPREEMFEGDTYVTNDPWLGTGHLHDITMVSPSFLDGRLVGFFACTAHVVDVGGRGFGADGKSVYEEGIQIPIMKFAERGDVNRDLIRILRANVREPNQVIGDFYSLASCNEVGHRRLVAMLQGDRPRRRSMRSASSSSRAPRAAMRERVARPAEGRVAQRNDDRRLRRADRARAAVDDRRGERPRRFRRQRAGQPLGHQRSADLRQGLCELRAEMRRRAGRPEQRGLARVLQRLVADQHPQRAAARAGEPSPRDRPSGAGSRARRARQGDAGPHPRRGRGVAVEHPHLRASGSRAGAGGARRC